MSTQDIYQICAGILFLASVALHLAKKNRSEVIFYAFQSAAIVALVLVSAVDKKSWALGVVALAAFVVKVVLAPTFLNQQLRQNKLKFAVSSYTNMPLTVAAIAGIFVLVQSRIFAPLTGIIAENHTFLVLALASMLVSLFLMINRKGALSQIIGVLSLENSIVAFGIFAGLEQSPMLQMGIMFDIFVWIIIATVFISMIYRHFESLDVTNMKDLKG